MLFFEVCFVFVEHFFNGQAENDVVADDFSDFFGGYALVEVVAWLNKHCWTNRACADAACSCDFAFFFHAELFNGIFERFQNFKRPERDAAA